MNPASQPLGSNPQQQVGEREVSDQLPFTDEQLQPLEVGIGQRGMPPYQPDEIMDGGRVDAGSGDAVVG